MKEFLVTVHIGGFHTFKVMAENENEAYDKIQGGKPAIGVTDKDGTFNPPLFSEDGREAMDTDKKAAETVCEYPSVQVLKVCRVEKCCLADREFDF